MFYNFLLKARDVVEVIGNVVNRSSVRGYTLIWVETGLPVNIRALGFLQCPCLFF